MSMQGTVTAHPDAWMLTGAVPRSRASMITTRVATVDTFGVDILTKTYVPCMYTIRARWSRES
jgi:hypothetical protein